MLDRLKAFARRMKHDITALYWASRDPRLPWRARLVVLLVVAYALSPIDLIPDVIPVLGYLDDLLLLPLGIALAIRLTPAEVWRDARARAVDASERPPRSRAGLWGVMTVWGLLALVLGVWLVKAL